VPSRSHRSGGRRRARSARYRPVQAAGAPTRVNLAGIRARGRHFTISSLVFVAACPIVAFTSYHGHSTALTFAVAAIVGILLTGIPVLVFGRPRPGGKPAARQPAWIVPIAIFLAALTSALLPGAFAVGLLGFGAGLFLTCFLVFGSDYWRVRRWDRLEGTSG
jgi:hypothetical protein